MHRDIASMALVTALLAAPAGLCAQAPGAPGAATVRALDEGTLEQRAAAVVGVLNGPSSGRSPDVMLALARELTRMNAVVAGRRGGTALTPSEWNSADVGDYYGDLIQANTRFESEATMTALAGALQTGRMATTAVAAYGQRAFPLVIRIFGDATAGVGEREGAGRVLERLLVDQRIDAGARQQVAALVGAVLARPEHVVVAMMAVDVAVATKEPALVAAVQRIADDPSAAHLDDRTGDDPRFRAMAQRRARAALGR